MGMEADLEPRVAGRHRVGVGILELVPERVEDPSLRAIRDNLADRVSALLVAIVVAAQLADVITTFRALRGSVYVEDNPLLHQLMVRSPAAAYAVKLLIVSAMVILVLSRLRGRRAQLALCVAAALSLIAPVLNYLLLMRG
jgi:hypothetical protein